MKTKITVCSINNMYVVWVLKHRNTGISVIDKNPSWNISRAFFTMQDAVNYQNNIK